MSNTNQNLLEMVQAQISADAKGSTPDQVNLATNAALPNLAAKAETAPSV